MVKVILNWIYIRLQKETCKQHKEIGEDMPLHRAIEDQEIENFSFKVNTVE
jgi:hypothetical protein